MTPARRVEVAPERLAGWVERFTASHGEVSWSVDRETSPSSWLGTAADGSWARMQGWADVASGAGAGVGATAGADGLSGPALDPTAAWLAPPGPLLVLLVRRGGYAAAVTSGGELVAHKVGTRHVQSRTAAGGWSQQRFARRRANQADELVEAVAGHAARVLAEGEERPGGGVAALLLGGDLRLVDQALGELASGPREWLQRLPRRELPDLPDPRRAVLDGAVRRGLAVRIEVHNA